MLDLFVIGGVGVLCVAGGVLIGRDTLARENRRLRRERDELLESQARAFAAPGAPPAGGTAPPGGAA